MGSLFGALVWRPAEFSACINPVLLSSCGHPLLFLRPCLRYEARGGDGIMTHGRISPLFPGGLVCIWLPVAGEEGLRRTNL